MIPAAMPASAGTRAMNGSTPASVRGAAGAGDAALAEQVGTHDREDDHEPLHQQPPGRGPPDHGRITTGATRAASAVGAPAPTSRSVVSDRHGDRRADRVRRAGPVGQRADRRARSRAIAGGRLMIEALEQPSNRSAGRTTRRAPGRARAPAGDAA